MFQQQRSVWSSRPCQPEGEVLHLPYSRTSGVRSACRTWTGSGPLRRISCGGMHRSAMTHPQSRQVGEIYEETGLPADLCAGTVARLPPRSNRQSQFRHQSGADAIAATRAQRSDNPDIYRNSGFESIHHPTGSIDFTGPQRRQHRRPPGANSECSEE